MHLVLFLTLFFSELTYIEIINQL